MKKIALSLYSPSPYWDDVINEIRKEFQVDVFYEYIKDNEKEWKQLECIDGSFYNKIGILGVFKALLNYDCIIFNRWNNYKNILLSLGLFFKNKNVCFMSDYPEEKKRTKIKESIKKFLMKNAVAIIAMSKSTKTYYETNYKECIGKTVIVPYIYTPVNNESEIDEYNNKRSKELRIKNSSIKIFISTRFIERKGYNVVYKAFNMLKDKNLLDFFEITIAGNGPLFEQYSIKFNNLSNKIRLLGWIEINDYIKNICKCDVFLHPSLLEPFGIPPLDAMIRGKLYIGSDKVMSTVSYINNGINGFQYPADDYENLANILQYICSKKELIYDIGKKGKIDTQKNYSGEIIRMGIRSIINKINQKYI